MTDNTKIKKLIQDSYITPEEKRELLAHLESAGTDMKLFDKFNDYLVRATRDRGLKYKETIKKIDSLQVELDKRVTSEKSEIEKKLEQELTDLDPQDLTTKTRIWREYYDMLDELGERYNRGLKDILSKILTTV